MSVSVPVAPKAVLDAVVNAWFETERAVAPVAIDCRALTLPSVAAPVPFSRFVPLKSEPSMIVPTCALSDSRSFEIAVRLSTSRPVSEASRAFDFIWLTRSEICSAPAIAVSVTLFALLSEEFTALSLPRLPRRVWAITYLAESSLVEATSRPVLMRLWVVSRPLLVALRLWRAAIAPTFVLTEKPMINSFLG